LTRTSDHPVMSPYIAPVIVIAVPAKERNIARII
jgi:hypothetical protein